MNWFLYSAAASVCLAIHILSLTKLTKLGLPTTFINAIVFSIATALLIFMQLYSKKSVSVNLQQGIWIAVAAISVWVVIVGTLEALKTAPNPGFVTAIENFSTVIVTLVAVLFLASSLTPLKFVGILLAITGITLISI